MKIRRVELADFDAIATLTNKAFGSTSEAEIIARLRRDNDDAGAWVAEQNSKIMGHIQLYKIDLEGQSVAGLGPICVHPDSQNKGIGKALIKHAVKALKAQDIYPLLFVLGHETYYPRFGFSSALGAKFEAPWSGPSFMALALRPAHSQCGRLIFPKAFG